MTTKKAVGEMKLGGNATAVRGMPVGLSAANPGGISNNKKLIFLDYIFGATAPATAPVTLWLVLNTGTFTAGTTDIATLQNGLTVEVTTTNWTNYARFSITNNATNWPAASGVASTQVSTKSNGTIFSFSGGNAAITGTGPTPTFWALVDSATLSAAANVVAVGPVTGGTAIVNGQNVNFPVGTLSISIT